jgi:hypothetical protein
VDILSSNAASQRAGVYLVVACLKVVLIFSEEGERDLSPWAIFPVCSDDEGDDSVTFGAGGLDWEELVGTIFALKVMNGWNNL